MHIRVLFFGLLKDLVGIAEDELEIREGASLADVFDHYAGRVPRIRELAGSIMLARNREFSELETPARDGDEIAFLPPVSGGTAAFVEEITEGGNQFALTRHPINTRRLVDALLNGGDGAVVTFEGVVRNHSNGRRTRFLEYECYQPMAIRQMAAIGRELANAYAIDHVGMIHRLGRLLIGETSVAVVVTAAHRKPAFDAALEGINRLKKRVPIWKKEFFADGEVWVEGEWDQHAPLAGKT